MSDGIRYYDISNEEHEPIAAILTIGDVQLWAYGKDREGAREAMLATVEHHMNALRGWLDEHGGEGGEP